MCSNYNEDYNINNYDNDIHDAMENRPILQLDNGINEYYQEDWDDDDKLIYIPFNEDEDAEFSQFAQHPEQLQHVEAYAVTIYIADAYLQSA